MKQEKPYSWRIGASDTRRALHVAGLALALMGGYAQAQDQPPVQTEPAQAISPAVPEKSGKPACLASHEVRHLVERGEVIPVHKALQIARTRSGGEVVKARLCPEQQELIYLLTLLDKNSQIRVVAMDARTGHLLVRP